VTSRNIGGITAASADRKASSAGSYGAVGGGYDNQPFQKSEPRADFVGNLTVPMANYLNRSLSISSFANTNIIGDGSQWSNIISSNIQIGNVTNVGLIGNYGGYAVNNTRKKIRGVLDIIGEAPTTIENDSINGYLNLWNVSQNMGAQKFYVVSIKDSNGIVYVNNNAISTWNGSQEPANVVIYPKKYTTSNISNENSGFKPQYRAFLDGANAQTGTAKIMPVDASFANAASYKGTVVSTGGAPNVYPLDEASWINAANNSNGAAPAPIAYSVADKLNGPNFGAIVASIAPQFLGVRVAGGARPVIEAVIPAKKKSRFEEALWLF
jgi:hypothetical protein